MRTPIGERVVKRRVENDGETIIMRKQRGKKAEWKLTIGGSSVTRKSKLFGLIKYDVIDTIFEAPKAMEWDFKNKLARIYPMNLNQIQQYINQWGVKKRGEAQVKQQSWLMYLVIGVGVVNFGLLLVIATSMGMI